MYLFTEVPTACDSDPCEHGGICEETDDGYQCQCPAGYDGDNCELGNTLLYTLIILDKSNFFWLR